MLMDINCGHFVANHQRFKDFYKPCSLCANCIAGEMIQKTLNFLLLLSTSPPMKPQQPVLHYSRIASAHFISTQQIRQVALFFHEP